MVSKGVASLISDQASLSSRQSMKNFLQGLRLWYAWRNSSESVLSALVSDP